MLRHAGLNRVEGGRPQNGVAICDTYYQGCEKAGTQEQTLSLTDLTKLGRAAARTDTAFGEAPLPDGQYCMVFEMRDALGNYAYSGSVIFECTDGNIITSVSEE